MILQFQSTVFISQGGILVGQIPNGTAMMTRGVHLEVLHSLVAAVQKLDCSVLLCCLRLESGDGGTGICEFSLEVGDIGCHGIGVGRTGRLFLPFDAGIGPFF